jgi:hypothetical protein
MKHLAFIFLMVIGLQVQGQEQEGTGIIKANPFGWFAGQYQFGYEHFLSEKLSVQLVPGVIFSKVTLSDSTDFTFESVQATRFGTIVIPEVRYYLGDVAPDGLYIAPFGRFRSVTTTVDNDSDVTRKRQSIGGGFVLGYQYQLANGLTGELFMGPQFKSSTTSYTGNFERFTDLSADDDDGTGIRFGATIGIGW